MGTQTAADGTALSATRFLGHSDATAVDGFTVTAGGADEFSYNRKFTVDHHGAVRFDRQGAKDAAVCDRLHRIRARTAKMKAAAAAEVQENAVHHFHKTPPQHNLRHIVKV